MRERNRTRATEPAQTVEQREYMPNGSEVYAKDSTRLKGYVVNHKPGVPGQCEAFDARKQSLGTGSQMQCFNLLDTPRAVRVASEVYIASKPDIEVNPRRRRK